MSNHLVQPPVPVAEAARVLLGYASFGAPADSLDGRQAARRSCRSTAMCRAIARAMHPRGAAERSAHAGLSGGARARVAANGRRRRLSPRHPARREQARHRCGAPAAQRDRENAIARAPGRALDLSHLSGGVAAPAGRRYRGRSTPARRDAHSASHAESVLLLDHVQDAAFLVRAMALRSDLAANAGDSRTAERWGTAVSELWAGADAPLASVVARMKGRATSGVR